MSDANPGPGSLSGMQERQHWGFQNRAINAAERDWLIGQARIHITDRFRRTEFIKWVRRGGVTHAKAVNLCKRWEIEFPAPGSTEN